ncbi:MAG: hypothetical protein WA364_09945, partial [Candidatus Nitrosopolaris sp.]
ESQVLGLIKFASEWDKYWSTTQQSPPNGNLQQPNNGSNNPGSNDNFSVWLNLLKSVGKVHPSPRDAGFANRRNYYLNLISQIRLKINVLLFVRLVRRRGDIRNQSVVADQD